MKDIVESIHPDYTEYKSIWQKCRDVVSGEDAVKKAGDTYLPKPTGQDQLQYKRYKQRARFFNATQRIVDAIVGQIFRRMPIIDPAKLQDGYITQDGKNIFQYAKEVLREAVIVGRVGTLIDHGQEIDDETYLIMYQAEDVINWKYQIEKGKKVPKLVVLREAVENTDAIFDHDYETRYRVLRIVDGIYVQNIWTKVKSEWVEGENIIPLMNGNPFDFIPFFMLTSSGVSFDVCKPIIKDVADINIGHYINSADFENDLHWSGIKTPCFPGWNTKTHGAPVVGKPIAVPVGVQPFMLESTSNSSIKDEMVKKEERMAVIGSQIIAQQGRYMQAAETAGIQRIGETSVLSALSENLDSYFKIILDVFSMWVGSKKAVTISFNKDFDPGEVNMDQLIKMWGMVQQGAFAYNTFYSYAKRNELVPRDRTSEQELAEIEDDEAARLEKLMQMPENNIEDEEAENQDDE